MTQNPMWAPPHWPDWQPPSRPSEPPGDQRERLRALEVHQANDRLNTVERLAIQAQRVSGLDQRISEQDQRLNGHGRRLQKLETQVSQHAATLAQEPVLMQRIAALEAVRLGGRNAKMYLAAGAIFLLILTGKLTFEQAYALVRIALPGMPPLSPS